MAKLNDAPFIKVEATKFTEVGYHGRDVDQIIRDLMDISMALTRKVWTDKLRVAARAIVEDKILDLLTGPANQSSKSASSKEKDGDAAAGTGSDARGRESFRDMLRQGILDDQEIEVDVPQGQPGGNGEPMGGDGTNPNLVAMSDLWQKCPMDSKVGAKRQPRNGKSCPFRKREKSSWKSNWKKCWRLST
jgi:ATP-dependent HslUV protease ATP-binding subunit HslU